MFMLIESIRSAMHSISVNKLRSFLTSLGIIIGVASIITVVSLIQGLQTSITSEFKGLGADGMYVIPKQDSQGLVVGYLTRDDVQYISDNIAEVEVVAPEVSVNVGRISYQGEFHQTSTVGVAAINSKVDDVYTAQGRYISAIDETQKRQVAVIGHTLIEKLKLPENPIGEFIQIGEYWFKIIGVLEQKGKVLGQDKDNRIHIPFDTAVNMLGFTKKPFMYIKISLFPNTDVDYVIDRVTDGIRNNHGLRPDEEDDFDIQTSEQIMQVLSTVTGIITAVFGGIVSISLLVGGIGIMNIMLVSVTERTKEVGILKALGAKRSDILLQFLIEAVVLCLCGGLIGLAIGYGLGTFAATMIPGVENAVFPLWSILLSIGFSTAIGVVFGILPAAKAANLDPIDALRFE